MFACAVKYESHMHHKPHCLINHGAQWLDPIRQSKAHQTNTDYPLHLHMCLQDTLMYMQAWLWWLSDTSGNKQSTAYLGLRQRLLRLETLNESVSGVLCAGQRELKHRYTGCMCFSLEQTMSRSRAEDVELKLLQSSQEVPYGSNLVP